MFLKLYNQILNKIFQLNQLYFKYKIKYNYNKLYCEILEFKRNDISKHASWITIYYVYYYIIKKKPKNILELGSGLSTLVILNAINYVRNIDSRYTPKFISMENNKKYLINTKKKIAKKYRSQVNLVLSKTIKDNFLIFSGYRYAKLPQIRYDFIFVDGPNYKDKNGMSCSFDIVYILKNISKKFYCIIDKRTATTYIMQKLIGNKSIKLSKINRISFLKVNYKNLKNSLNSNQFKKDFFNNIEFKGYY
jgi:predicted O-methyltransferase YrrM